MAITPAFGPATAAAAAAAALLLAGCSASGSVTEAVGTTASAAATPSVSAPPADPATSDPTTAGPSTADPGTADGTPSDAATGTAADSGTALPTSGSAAAPAEVDPCSLLDAAAVQDVLGVEVDAGVEDRDEARQVRMCTWQRSDPVAIVVAGVTSVGADEAYTTNKDLAPAYFGGEAVEKPVAGTDRAYVVASGDTGYAVGLVAQGRYLSVQVAADGVTEEQAVSLAERAAAALPAG